jgi:hypothetical protein
VAIIDRATYAARAPLHHHFRRRRTRSNAADAPREEVARRVVSLP